MDFCLLSILCFFLFLPHRNQADEMGENAMVDYLTKNNYLHGKAEIVFLLDRSGSVGAANFEDEKGFVESFLTHVVVDANATRVAVISYSGTAVRHIDYLHEPKTKCFLSQELQEVVFEDSGATNIAAAFQEASLVLQNARPNVNKVVVLISDGLANVGGDPVPYATELKMSGVQIFCFGIGRYLKTQLLYLASSANHVFSSSGFVEFKRLARKIRGDPHEVSWSGQEAVRKCDHLCNSPYKGEVDDPGCCDHSARCSCALLSGMHTCVCGPGYFGLSGLAGDCRACPRGTYKSKIEPTRACTPCPDGATTAEIASTSLKDCYCKEGYVGDPTKGINCTMIKCPALQPPNHGRLLGEECSTVYGSSCFFLCDEGYEIQEGSSDLRVCQSNGEWSGVTTVCREIRCEPLLKPRFGLMICNPGQLTVGKKCRFNCYKGYIQGGSSERECLSTKKWSGAETECIPVECNIPNRISYGMSTCSSVRKPQIGQSCMYKCMYGFEIVGPSVLTCEEDGKMHSMFGKDSNTSCKDITPPEIKCPDPFEVTTEQGQNYALLKWMVPLPTDNSGITPKLLIKPYHIKPPFKFPLGRSSFSYIAIDAVGLSSTCEVFVEVTDQEPPKVIRCPPRIEVGTTGVDTIVGWREPEFTDNSKKIVKILKNYASGSMFSIGTHYVRYEAFDANGNSAICEFEVIVSQTMCPHYPAPANGAFTCHDWIVGQFCQAYCNDKHDFVQKPASWYICNEEAKWVTEPENMPVPWPDCAKPIIPRKVRQMLSGFYYNGDCNDPAVQKLLKKAFLNQFQQHVEKSDLCVASGKCSVKTVSVTCGRITDEYEVKRRRRDVWEHAQKEELELEFEILIDVDQEINDTAAVLQEFLETIRNLKWDLESEVNEEVSTVAAEISNGNNLGESVGSLGSLVLTDELTEITCKPGSVLKDDSCVLCPSGTYFDTSQQDCVDCPAGYYQENEGQLQCVRCPEGMSTESKRTRDRKECKAICLPGTYSETGLETCVACPIGSYQEINGSTNCTTCPSGSTTSNIQSASIQDCKEICPPGSFSLTGLIPCDLCPKSQYQSLPGQTECLECPSNLSTNQEGAVDISLCLDIDPCQNITICQNGGYCKRVGRAPFCICSQGFEGNYCEVDMDECVQNPCSNDGQCINEVGSFSCICKEGFSGRFCEIETDECASLPCMNNGTCLDKVNGYICVCPRGYEGDNCESVQEICFHDIICLHGICVYEDGNGSTACECDPGFSGVDCSIDIDECENATCLNNGSCIDGVSNFTCECVEGFEGQFCEINIDDCENNLCTNGSTCLDRVGHYDCICPPGWNGTLCENKMSSDFILKFSESSATIANMASSTLNSSMSEVTVSLWVQTTDEDHSGTPLSYAVASASSGDSIVDNALTISDCNGIQIYVNNEPLVTDSRVNDGQWHHLAFTWSSKNTGTWELYTDGKLSARGEHLRPHDVIEGGGTIVLGQEQDTVGGGFSPMETFTGNITRLNIWNSYFSTDNITRLCNKDDDIPGKVIAWPDFLNGLKGDVQVVDNSIRPNTLSE